MNNGNSLQGYDFLFILATLLFISFMSVLYYNIFHNSAEPPEVYSVLCSDDDRSEYKAKSDKIFYSKVGKTVDLGDISITFTKGMDCKVVKQGNSDD